MAEDGTWQEWGGGEELRPMHALFVLEPQKCPPTLIDTARESKCCCASRTLSLDWKRGPSLNGTVFRTS